MNENEPTLFEQTGELLDEEDAETLAAIERGLRDAAEGRMVSADEARRRLESWTTKSSTPKPR